MAYHLYRKEYEPNSLCQKFEIRSFEPSFFCPFLKQERKSLRLFLVRLYFIVITKGHFSIYFVLSEDGVLMHTTCVLGKNFKFPFMKKNDVEIGPCITLPKYRNKGIYSMMLNYISSLKKYEKTSFYMLVHEDNIPSICGVEKAKFQRIGVVSRSKILKVYQTI